MAERKRTPMREQRYRYIKRKIHKVAVELFDQYGFPNVKVSDICEKANVSTGTFYNYFPSKEHILIDYADGSDAHFNKLARTLSYESAKETLHTLVQQKIELVTAGGPERLAYGFIATINHHYSGSFDINRKAYGLFQRTMEEGIANGEFRPDIDPVQSTSELRYILGGLMIHWCIEQGSFDITEQASELLDTFISHISVPTAGGEGQ